ncbi:MAG: thrombospondin type 3 repeat-containing protein [Opitutae bacterium]|nr:thrombospondin type 3 repeat-containing protein [Opitutae bacterium]
MKTYLLAALVCLLSAGGACLRAAYTDASDAPFSVSNYIDKNDSAIVAWATGYQNLIYGSNVSDNWKTPERALGPAVGGSYDIVSLGRGGQITLTFTNPIRNGDGPDFCVFENGFSDTFLELAWVEVSTDGVHYVRFSNFSLTAATTGSDIDPTLAFGLASRYRSGRGTVFDLDQLSLAYQAALANKTDFSVAYETHLETNYPYLDLEDIRYVRIVDIVGNGSAFDSDGYVIYDAYPTIGSAGFDLEAVGVLNSSIPDGDDQAITFAEISHQRLSDTSLELTAVASSGLPVEYEVLAGSPATLSGTMLTFTGTGTVQVMALQPGDGVYNPAGSVLRTFVVADSLQHIYFAPISNQIVGGSALSLSALADSGLPVQLEVTSSPAGVVVGAAPEYTLTLGTEVGTVKVRAWQAGDSNYAPAEDVYLTFEIVSAGSSAAPRSFAQWQSSHSLVGDVTQDSDGDGVSDFLEFAAGTDPLQASSSARPQFTSSGDDGFILTVQVSRRAAVHIGVESTSNLGGDWTTAVPELISVQDANLDGEPIQIMQLRVRPSVGKTQGFWQFKLEAL